MLTLKEMSEINNNVLKEKVKRTALVKKKLDEVQSNITKQIIESEKTDAYINIFKEVALKQKDQLDYFNKEKEKLDMEFNRLKEELSLLQSDYNDEGVDISIDAILQTAIDESKTNRKRKHSETKSPNSTKESNSTLNKQSKSEIVEKLDKSTQADLIPNEVYIPVTKNSNDNICNITTDINSNNSSVTTTIVDSVAISPSTFSTNIDTIANNIINDAVVVDKNDNNNNLNNTSINTSTNGTPRKRRIFKRSLPKTISITDNSNGTSSELMPSLSSTITTVVNNVVSTNSKISPVKGSNSSQTITASTSSKALTTEITKSSSTSASSKDPSNVSSEISKSSIPSSSKAPSNVSIEITKSSSTSASSKAPSNVSSEITKSSSTSDSSKDSSNVSSEKSKSSPISASSKVSIEVSKSSIPTNSKALPLIKTGITNPIIATTSSSPTIKSNKYPTIPKTSLISYKPPLPGQAIIPDIEIDKETTKNKELNKATKINGTTKPNSTNTINLTNYKDQILSDSSKAVSNTKSPAESSVIQILLNPSKSTFVKKLDSQYLVNNIINNRNGIFLSGTKGLLYGMPNGDNSLYYIGHHHRDIMQIYQIQDCIVSVTTNHINIHKISNATYMKVLGQFTHNISCTCYHKTTIYVALTNCDLYIIETSSRLTTHKSGFFKSPVSTMAVTRIASKNFMVIAETSGRVQCLDFESDPIKCKILGKTDGLVIGIVSDSNLLVLYTSHYLYMVEKVQWTMTELRYLTHQINCVALDVCNLVLADSRRNLHRYILKNSHISQGSSIESLEKICSKPISAIHVNVYSKKITIACGNEVFYVKL